ncbi:MAG: lipolytic protein family [Segetibacter sp.]|nr:lipolytic protein family [Segetibacter sp.]
MLKSSHSYLALGDSYTIGEGVPFYEAFPYQVVQIIRKKGYSFYGPEMAAKTGWTTTDLANHLIQNEFRPAYDFVTLLIGVNNQYQGMSAEDYQIDFEFLLKEAIQFASGKVGCVTVLSIPDWGVTPYAEGKDRYNIYKEIELYNNINADIAKQYNCRYIDITPGTREAAYDSSLLTGDQLHPSGKEYARWAHKIAEGFIECLRDE